MALVGSLHALCMYGHADFRHGQCIYSSNGLGGQGPGSIGLREMAACRRKAGWPVLAKGLLLSVSESC